MNFAKCATPFCARCNVIKCHPVHNSLSVTRLPPVHYSSPTLHPRGDCSHLFRFSVFEASSPLSIRRQVPNSFVPRAVNKNCCPIHHRHISTRQSVSLLFLCRHLSKNTFCVSASTTHRPRDNQKSSPAVVVEMGTTMKKRRKRSIPIARNFSSIKLC